MDEPGQISRFARRSNRRRRSRYRADQARHHRHDGHFRDRDGPTAGHRLDRHQRCGRGRPASGHPDHHPYGDQTADRSNAHPCRRQSRRSRRAPRRHLRSHRRGWTGDRYQDPAGRHRPPRRDHDAGREGRRCGGGRGCRGRCGGCRSRQRRVALRGGRCRVQSARPRHRGCDNRGDHRHRGRNSGRRDSSRAHRPTVQSHPRQHHFFCGPGCSGRCPRGRQSPLRYRCTHARSEYRRSGQHSACPEHAATRRHSARSTS
ncbi:Uncharacterised protein [Nocardia brasiliensis]|nr:Uncharacterised protein [Nocardia brasiliensis]